MQLLEPRSWFDAQLLDQDAPPFAVHLQGLGASAGEVVGEHQMRPGLLPERVFGDDGRQSRHHGAVPPQLELECGVFLVEVEPQLGQPVGGDIDATAVDAFESRPAPQRQRVLEVVGGVAEPSGTRGGAGAGDGVVQLPEVQPVVLEVERVSGMDGVDQVVDARLVPEDLAQRGDTDGDLVARRRRWVPPPHRLDQGVDRDRLARRQQKHRQDSPLPGAA